jgi:hypothetical protein
MLFPLFSPFSLSIYVKTIISCCAATALSTDIDSISVGGFGAVDSILFSTAYLIFSSLV